MITLRIADTSGSSVGTPSACVAAFMCSCGHVCRTRDIRFAVGAVARERCVVGFGHDPSSCATLGTGRGAKLTLAPDQLTRTLCISSCSDAVVCMRTCCLKAERRADESVTLCVQPRENQAALWRKPNTVMTCVLRFVGWSVGDGVGATRRLRLHPAVVSLIPLTFVSLVPLVVSFVALVNLIVPRLLSFCVGLGVGGVPGHVFASNSLQRFRVLS